jgi:hypothetical protein
MSRSDLNNCDSLPVRLCCRVNSFYPSTAPRGPCESPLQYKKPHSEPLQTSVTAKPITELPTVRSFLLVRIPELRSSTDSRHPARLLPNGCASPDRIVRSNCCSKWYACCKRIRRLSRKRWPKDLDKTQLEASGSDIVRWTYLISYLPGAHTGCVPELIPQFLIAESDWQKAWKPTVLTAVKCTVPIIALLELQCKPFDEQIWRRRVIRGP